MGWKILEIQENWQNEIWERESERYQWEKLIDIGRKMIAYDRNEKFKWLLKKIDNKVACKWEENVNFLEMKY
jgi:hypothetical protein